MKFVLFRHGHSLANQESRIVSSLENGTRTDGGPEGTGFGLSSKGRLEVAETSKSLAEHIIASSSPSKSPSGHRTRVRILTSPFQRTLHTSAIIQSQLLAAFSHHLNNNTTTATTTTNATTHITLQSNLEVTPDLRERYFGDFEMRTPSDDLYNKVWSEDANNPFHQMYGVESVMDVTQRVSGVIRNLEQEGGGGSAGGEAEGSGEEKKEEEGEEWVILVSHGDSLQILQTAMKGWSGDRHRQLEHLETANWRVVEWCPDLRSAHDRRHRR
ncbi:hypothetical protein BGZ95_005418 [Linnemannia exigua]|uniref:Phosphoglycerate mutase-like protein n=1 Tax=Linnemannia exigua TaxID=604196 RepID=A0AAD4DII0_9FUNG|nr:hypothetical protein BGZ95_005418 [Linnemannia exigua]